MWKIDCSTDEVTELGGEMFGPSEQYNERLVSFGSVLFAIPLMDATQATITLTRTLIPEVNPNPGTKPNPNTNPNPNPIPKPNPNATLPHLAELQVHGKPF